jgi:HAD superfamily hydrolase (TIGR01509 family)
LERRGVLFDLDGTLLDSEPVWEAAMATLVQSLAPGSAAIVTAGLSGMATADAVALVHERLGLAQADVQAAVSRLERDVTNRQSRDPRWRPGVHDLLTDLRSAGFATALVTSNSRAVVAGLLVDDLRGLFDVVVCVEDVHRVKPAADPYLQAASLLGLRPERCVAVEDSAAGVASAMSAGCAVVQLGSPDAPHVAGIEVVADLAGLDAAFMERVLGRPS